jgi:WhiB family redox-sensing transcriptional regulator
MSGDAMFMQSGLCAQTDPEAFYPERGYGTRAAKAVCAACPVRPECLAYALERGERFGVWGGMSERERRRLLKTDTPVGITAERRVA